MNKRLDVAAKVLLSQDLSSDDGTKAKVKTLAEYREEAATMLVACDMAMLEPKTVETAIIAAGYEPAEYLEPFLNIIAALNKTETENVFFLSDMKEAWARGHENGFWDARQSGATKSKPVDAIENKGRFSETDIQTAEAQGYVSGWTNGILSQSSLPNDPAEMPLLGAEHGKATNPYSPPVNNEEDHALWCGENHSGPCRRGRVTGTEKGNENE